MTSYSKRPWFPDPHPKHQKPQQILQQPDSSNQLDTDPTPTQNEDTFVSSGSLLDDISKFSKAHLRPTVTVVRDLSSVIVSSAKTDIDNEELQEWEDDEHVLDQKIEVLKSILLKAQHSVVYTGAGISTSAKIPDYRGPTGIWTLQAQGKQMVERRALVTVQPTFAHRALKTLLDHRVIKHIVSTNVDGLHRRSGVKKSDLSELHGNAFIEKCPVCHTEYLRDFDCVEGGQREDHLTGRGCDQEGCQGKLVDSIINFGESLPVSELKTAKTHSKKSDLALVLGTSMRVTPASQLPLYSIVEGKLVICNLQRTQYDEYAYVRIFATTDVVMEKLMSKLEIDVPQNP